MYRTLNIERSAASLPKVVRTLLAAQGRGRRREEGRNQVMKGILGVRLGFHFTLCRRLAMPCHAAPCRALPAVRDRSGAVLCCLSFLILVWYWFPTTLLATLILFSFTFFCVVFFMTRVARRLVCNIPRSPANDKPILPTAEPRRNEVCRLRGLDRLTFFFCAWLPRSLTDRVEHVPLFFFIISSFWLVVARRR